MLCHQDTLARDNIGRRISPRQIAVDYIDSDEPYINLDNSTAGCSMQLTAKCRACEPP